MDHNTSVFAVQTIRRWWHDVGAARYPGARHLTITAHGGGSNASRSRLWKRTASAAARVFVRHNPAKILVTGPHARGSATNTDAFIHRFVVLEDRPRAWDELTFLTRYFVFGGKQLRDATIVRHHAGPWRNLPVHPPPAPAR